MGRVATMTYGEMPTREQFDEGWFQAEPRGDLYRFGNDRRVGTCMMSCEDLWQEIVKAHGEFACSEFDPQSLRNADIAGEWCSCVLETLGIEWV